MSVPFTNNDNDTLADSFAHGTSMIAEDILTKPHKTYLFGHPISHSMSPLLHNTLFADHSIPWTYTLHESLSPNSFLPLLRAADCIGSAVTMPHKVTFMQHVDALTDEAATIGSINTVFLRRDPTTSSSARRYIGANTDCIGVREAFLQNCAHALLARARGKPALVIGGGGACRSSVYALWRWFGASRVYLVNRERHEVDEVMAGFKAAGFPAELVWVGSIEEARALETPALVVGTIPDFEPREEGEKVCRGIAKEFLERDGEKGAMLEMCYHPKPVTALYTLAEEAGWMVVPGTEAMVHQGIAQQMLWTERRLEDFSLEHMKAVVREELERRWTK